MKIGPAVWVKSESFTVLILAITEHKYYQLLLKL